MQHILFQEQDLSDLSVLENPDNLPLNDDYNGDYEKESQNFNYVCQAFDKKKY